MRYVIAMMMCVLLVGCAQEQMVGDDKDEHGCIASAGYSWCEARGACVRVWETPCTAVDLCRKEGVSVYQCGEVVKEVYAMPGKGAVYYKADWSEVSCQVLAPEYTSEECKELMELDCTLVCQREVVGTEEEAERISVDYVESLPAYQEGGKEIGVESIEKMTCTGCYNVKLRYTLNDGSVTKVEISLVNMDISDVTTRDEGGIGGSGSGGAGVSVQKSFLDCERKGYPIMESYPRQCRYPDGVTVTESICEDLCGDGTCQEMVCMGEGCPCAESASSCPSDCS